jgi:hypothetical protein
MFVRVWYNHVCCMSIRVSLMITVKVNMMVCMDMPLACMQQQAITLSCVHVVLKQHLMVVDLRHHCCALCFVHTLRLRGAATTLHHVLCSELRDVQRHHY